MRSLIAILVLLVALPALAQARTMDRYASIAVDEDTGEVLHARNADKLRHPASLTKVMTLYLLFDAIKRGEVGLDDRLMVSKHAAAAKPTKIGLKAGTTISVEDAIRAMVTRSANDAAVVVAERLGGGESRFAGMMTQQAKKLGMTRTRYVNASGLPDNRQVTTARDMAILADAIYRDFPKMFHYFSLSKFVWKGRSYGNHNWLVGHVKGVDGMKTGYTNASGYNVAVTAHRNGKRVIVVVFGGATAAQRDAHAMDLVNAAYKALDKRSKLFARTWPGADFSEVKDPAEEPVVPPAGLPDQVAQGDTDEKRGVRIIIDGQEPAPKPITVSSNGAWMVQVGAYSKAEQAQFRLKTVRALGFPQLKSAGDAVQASSANGKTIYRARFAGFSANAAHSLCRDMQTLGEACIALGN